MVAFPPVFGMSAAVVGLATIVAPLAAFLLLGLLRPLRATGTPAAAVAIVAALVSTACAFALVFAGAPREAVADLTVPWLVSAGQTWATLGVYLDATSVPMLAVVTLVGLCVQVYSLGYLHDEPKESFGRYYAFHSLFLVAMLLLVVAKDLLQLFVGWELVGLASYLLIGFWWQKPSAARAAVKAFWLTKLADIGLGAAIVVLYVQTHALDWSPATVQALGPAGATLVAALLFVAVMGKSAQFPLHVWLPDAMEGPTPVSALLHAATMVAAGVYLLVRAWPIFDAAPDVRLAMAWIGAFTGLFASVVACAQTDIKKVLAYSTCAQLGYMVAAAGAGAIDAAYAHLIGHAAFKALLFLGAGCLIHAVHSNELADMGGLLRRLKFSGGAFIVGALALGLYPSKELVLAGVGHAGLQGPLVLLLAAAGLTAFYMTRSVLLALFGPASAHADHAHEAPASMLAPVLLLALLSVAGFALFDSVAPVLVAVRERPHSWLGHIAHGLALAGFAVGFALYGPRRRDALALPGVRAGLAFVRAAAVDRAFQAAYRMGLLAFSRSVAWVDRYLIDGVMNLSAFASQSGAERARRIQTGKTYDYLTAVVAGLLLLAVASVYAR